MSDLEKIPMFVGSYSKPDQAGLYSYEFSTQNGEISFKEEVSGLENPSYLCLSAAGDRLFAVNEFKDGNRGKVTAYELTIDKQTRYLSEVDYEGAGSCYISIDSGSKHLFIANYIGGSLVVLALNDEVNSMKPVQTINFSGSGPNAERQEKSHIHSAILSTDEKYLYATDLGADRLYIFNYAPESDEPIRPADPLFVSLPPGCGPRHMVCHPSGRWLYLLCELSGDLFVVEQGEFKDWIQVCNVTPKGATGKVEAADLQIDSRGKRLYATNRGDFNQIIIFKIDEQNGKLGGVQFLFSQGNGPRSIALDPTEQYLVVANEKGNSIAMFDISTDDGAIRYMGRRVEVHAPACIKF
ncbi:MAG: lactonase family protein [Sphingobacteriales bacterium]|nr:MAG: lactonase family protein [Sphingobacteriales bacterium]